MTTVEDAAAAVPEAAAEALGAAATRGWVRRACAWARVRVPAAGRDLVSRAAARTAGARAAASPVDYRPMSITQLRAFIKGGSRKSGAERGAIAERAHDAFMRFVAIPVTFVGNCLTWPFQRPTRFVVAAAIVFVLYK